jgi:hypothetical protein
MMLPDDEKAIPSNLCKSLGGARLCTETSLASNSIAQFPSISILSGIKLTSHATVANIQFYGFVSIGSGLGARFGDAGIGDFTADQRD